MPPAYTVTPQAGKAVQAAVPQEGSGLGSADEAESPAGGSSNPRDEEYWLEFEGSTDEPAFLALIRSQSGGEKILHVTPRDGGSRVLLGPFSGRESAASRSEELEAISPQQTNRLRVCLGMDLSSCKKKGSAVYQCVEAPDEECSSPAY